jgi:CYTH domain-containing protein
MEIERKWLVKELPYLSDKIPVLYERHFLFIGNGIEIRIQKKGDKYEFERKEEISDLSRTDQKFEISSEEFEELKKLSKKSLIRESFFIDDNPEITLKVYKGDYEGLIRVEVEFNSEEEAQAFKPLKWFGEEITHTVIGKDKNLVELSKDEFLKLIN